MTRGSGQLSTGIWAIFTHQARGDCQAADAIHVLEVHLGRRSAAEAGAALAEQVAPADEAAVEAPVEEGAQADLVHRKRHMPDFSGLVAAGHKVAEVGVPRLVFARERLLGRPHRVFVPGRLVGELQRLGHARVDRRLVQLVVNHADDRRLHLRGGQMIITEVAPPVAVGVGVATVVFGVIGVGVIGVIALRGREHQFSNACEQHQHEHHHQHHVPCQRH